MSDLTVQNQVDNKDVFVTYQAFESMREEENDIVYDGKDVEDVKTVKSRPVLMNQSVAPSVFQSSLRAYQKHLFIAVHQTYMEQLVSASTESASLLLS
jgi:hypothetical protein